MIKIIDGGLFGIIAGVSLIALIFLIGFIGISIWDLIIFIIGKVRSKNV